MKNTSKILIVALTVAIGWFAYLNIIMYKFVSNNPPCYEYQVDLTLDSAYIYNLGRFVGVCPHGQHGIDSVICKDNE